MPSLGFQRPQGFKGPFFATLRGTARPEKSVAAAPAPARRHPRRHAWGIPTYPGARDLRKHGAGARTGAPARHPWPWKNCLELRFLW